MADFCKECSEDMFGPGFNDMAGLTTAEDTAAKRFPSVLCEGCGFTLVDHEGVCQGGCTNPQHGGKPIDKTLNYWYYDDLEGKP